MDASLQNAAAVTQSAADSLSKFLIESTLYEHEDLMGLLSTRFKSIGALRRSRKNSPNHVCLRLCGYLIVI